LKQQRERNLGSEGIVRTRSRDGTNPWHTARVERRKIGVLKKKFREVKANEGAKGSPS